MRQRQERKTTAASSGTEGTETMTRRKYKQPRRISQSEARAIESVWTNPTFHAMRVEEKTTWLYLLTGPHTAQGVPGLFRLTEDEVYAGVDLVVHDGDLSERELVEQYVAHFVELGWLQVDEKNGVMRLADVVADIDDSEATEATKALPDCRLVDEYLGELLTNSQLDDYYRLLAKEMGLNT